MCFRARWMLGSNLGPTLTSYVTLGKSFNFSEPQASQLYNKNSNLPLKQVLLRRFYDIIYVNHLTVSDTWKVFTKLWLQSLSFLSSPSLAGVIPWEGVALHSAIVSEKTSGYQGPSSSSLCSTMEIIMVKRSH